MKRFISLVIAFCIILTLVPTSFAQSDNYLTLDSKLSIVDSERLTKDIKYLGYEKILVDGEVTTFDYYDSLQQRKVIVSSKSKNYIGEFDKVNGIVKLNDEVIAKISPEDSFINLNDPELNNSLAASHKWVLYDTDEGYASVAARDVLAVATILSLLCGGVGVAILIVVAERIVDHKLDGVWYVVRTYYKDPITTSRPELKKWMRFYADSSYDDLIGEADMRY